VTDFITSAWWDHLALLALPVGLVASLTFVVRYQSMVGRSWWRMDNGKPNYFGRFMMERKLTLALLFALLLAGRIVSGRIFREVPDVFPGQGLLLAVLLWVFALQTFVPYRLLLMAQEEAPTKEASRS
jgi:hypothetical protein